MTLPLYLTFIGVFTLSIVIIWNTIYYRKKIPCMTGMMIAMVLGMSTGLTIGVILGILYADNLFYSTVLSMAIGLLAGFLAGLPISLMAVLDGTLSGVMGGMMGAMLGVMISSNFQDSIIKIMFLLFIGTILILFRMMDQEFMKRKGLLSHPLIILCIFALFSIGYNQLGPLVSASNMSNDTNHQHNGMNPTNLVIKADEFSFTPNRIEVAAGESLTVVLDNIGEVEHDLEIIGIKVENVKSSSLHDHQGNHNQIHVHSKPGKKQEITFTPTTPGTYRYTCTIPGHAESGMTGMIEVTS
ncbi:cupredoxin domain-containing protein [Virgibacillus oceani]|uniref:Blue (type 1) copper domain-containing protein n=1 Tax=Virgibacillus oceani TaxID=1479511 RepID=A0A917LVW1_9BACI|nr:plastocyanin/azurin family copper-binding protein [Virgibacillus oceani]GGG61167.1 hypothetical protein GCM10011398_00550 [Virgibacillus oceani]